MNDAPPETPVATMKDATNEEKMDYIINKIEELTDEFGTIFSYKLIADYCIYILLQHHNEAFSRYFEDHNEETAICWARDAGQLQVAGKTIRDIMCGPDDFLVSQESDSSETSD